MLKKLFIKNRKVIDMFVNFTHTFLQKAFLSINKSGKTFLKII